MTGKEIKEYIIENNRTIDILNAIGMYNIDDTKSDYISCSFPDGDNLLGCLIYPSLYIRAHTRNIKNKQNFNPDIFDLVEFMTQKAPIPFIKGVLGLEGNNPMVVTPIADGLDIFRKIKKRKKVSNNTTFFSENILSRFVMNHHIDLLRKDDILPSSAPFWDLGIDIQSNRIIFTHRDWNTGKIIGVVGRTLIQAYHELKIPKYMTLVGAETFLKSKNIYGLYQNKKYIEESKKMILFESEKSVIKVWQYGYRVAGALGCHELSEYQIAIMVLVGVKEVTLAYDSDISTLEILEDCKKLEDNGIKAMYIDVSKTTLFANKCSPCDKGKQMWDLLYEHRKEFKESDVIG